MKQKRIPLVGEQYLVPFILITSLFFLWGFAHAILDVLNKHFQELLDITKAHSAFIQAMMYMGYFIMAIPAGLFISRFGYRRGVVFGLLLYGIGSLLFIPGQYYLSFNMFLFALFVIGCGLTFLETAANPYATELGAKETAASRSMDWDVFAPLYWQDCFCFRKTGAAVRAMWRCLMSVWG